MGEEADAMWEAEMDRAGYERGRICSYCLCDHEIYGGCFTGKKPSELRAERRAALQADKGGGRG